MDPNILYIAIIIKYNSYDARFSTSLPGPGYNMSYW